MSAQNRAGGGEGVSRRGLISAAAGALALGAGWTPARGAPPRTIDTHHHCFPPGYVTRRRADILAVSRGFEHVVDWTPKTSLAAMDEAGIDLAVLSVSTPGVWLGEAAASRQLARACNEYAAGVVRDHPGRFAFFANLPAPDEPGALQEIAHAFDVLGAAGAVLMTSYQDRYLGDPAFARVLAELDRRKAVVFLHPTDADCCRALVPELPPAFVEFPTDTTRTAASLLFSGTLARLRDLRFVFSHGGGTLPMLTGRLGMWVRRKPELGQLYPSGLQAELARHYFDIVSIGSAPARAALAAFVPPTQLLFGSDFPYGPIRPLLDDLSAIAPGAPERAMIFGANAARALSLV